MNGSDILRALVYGQAFLVIVLTLIILRRYIGRIFDPQSGTEQALPSHIVLICASYLILVVAGVCEIYPHFGKTLSWRTPTYLVAFALGDFALIFMLMHLSVRSAIVTAVLAAAQKAAKEELDSRQEANTRQLQRIEEAGSKTHEEVVALHGAVSEASEKADKAYEEANAANEKIAHLRADTRAALKKTKEK